MEEVSPGIENQEHPNNNSLKKPVIIIAVVLLLFFVSGVSYLLGQNSIKTKEEIDNPNPVKPTYIPTLTKLPEVTEKLQLEPTITQKVYLLSNQKKVEIQVQGFKNEVYLIEESGLKKKIYVFETPFGSIMDFVESDGYFALTHIGSLEAEEVKLFNPSGVAIPLGESEEDIKNFRADRESAVGRNGGMGDTIIRFYPYKAEKTLEVVFRVVEDWVYNYDLTGRYIKGSFRVVR